MGSITHRVSSSYKNAFAQRAAARKAKSARANSRGRGVQPHGDAAAKDIGAAQDTGNGLQAHAGDSEGDEDALLSEKSQEHQVQTASVCLHATHFVSVSMAVSASYVCVCVCLLHSFQRFASLNALHTFQDGFANSAGRFALDVAYICWDIATHTPYGVVAAAAVPYLYKVVRRCDRCLLSVMALLALPVLPNMP